MEATIKEQAKRYLEYCTYSRGMTEATLRHKRYTLLELERAMPVESLNELTNEHINNWVRTQTERGCKATTINTRLAHSIAFFKWERDMGVPLPKLKVGLLCRKKQAPPRRVYYSREQINTVLRYADRRAWLMIKLAFDCGLRINELRTLRLFNVNDRRLTFEGKGRKRRAALMSKEARDRLTDWVEREKITDYLFPGAEVDPPTPLSVSQTRKTMRAPFIKAGLTDFYPHALRHSFATDLQAHKAGVAEIQHMLGHSNIATTEVYLHGFDNGLDGLYEEYKFADADPDLR